ncbi:5'-3' exonuclease H3TH domain-containing protein [Jatrophihabitans endophyticus]|uniref:5'-3' exonuclease n=1 Tax=Jatrophihabitans endophyticus TaxID=1206085 RepID=UPI0019F1BFFC|nr:5'-3' exonuclease H3TH domain-containing protein [Jatrophihabitans endophyticus]MBE7188302.1 5'-3' exonuclease [Jatrophihabitans endophyticus]
MSHPVLLAVDGNSLVHRSYHAQARSEQPSWAVRGLLTQLVAAVERVRPVAVVVGFDDATRSLRRERWPQYKAHRGEKLESLVDQLAEAVQAVRDLGVAVVVPDGLEADDVLASCAAFAPRHGARTVVVTSDRDAFALIGEHTHVLRIINGGVDASPTMTPERLVLLLGVRPDQYRDFAALRGDASDNLPGVRGIGARTAARLLEVFGTARAAFDDIEAVRAALGAGVARRLSADGAREAWELNCQVMAMHDDVDLGLRLDAGCGVLPFEPAAVERVFRSLNLTWTAATAARVLADVETPAQPRAVHAETMLDQRSAGRWRTGSRRLPRLRPTAPAAEQLSLF